jgi:drug/metabolite transporter (DMT)-like permease
MSGGRVPGRGIDYRGWVLFGLLSVMWGSSYFWIKLGVATVPPFTLVAARLFIGILVLAAAVRILRVPLPRDWATHRRLILLSFVSVALPFTLITIAQQTVDSALASVLNSTVPLFTIAMAARLFPDEPMTVGRLGGLIVGFLGVVVLIGPDVLGGLGSSFGGQVLLVGSSIAYALGNVYARRAVRGLRPVVPAFFEVIYAFAMTAPIAMLLEAPWNVRAAPIAFVSIGWLGLFGSGLAFLVYFGLIARWGSTRTSVVAYMLPVVGISLGVLVLNETADVRLLGGSAMIIAGVALLNSRRGGRRLFGREAREPVPPR